MVSDRMMKFVLRGMSTDAEPMENLVERLHIAPGNLRKILNAMADEDLNLVEKVRTSSQLSTRYKGHCRIGWRKTARV